MSLGNLPFVTVIIPTRNEVKHVAECLTSIVDGTYPHPSMEILVVDGESDDGTPEIIQSFAERHAFVRLLRNPARTVPYAMNIGIREARGELIVRMDAHAHYGPDYLKQLVTWMQRLAADNVGGVSTTRPASAAPQARAVAIILSHPLGVGPSLFRVGATAPIEVDTVPFGCYRREIFARIGTYDERFVRNQDDELNARLKSAGGRIFLVPEIRIEYVARESLRKMARMLYQYGYFKPLIAIKLGRPATVRQLAPPVFTAAVLGLPLLFWQLPWTLYVWGIAVGAHGTINLVVSASLARANSWRLFPYLICGFLLGHLAYGTGYLRGLFDFAILRRHLTPSLRDIRLSR
jgi:glycosyltransferase involved in cell wall biosynthesis